MTNKKGTAYSFIDETKLTKEVLKMALKFNLTKKIKPEDLYILSTPLAPDYLFLKK